MTEQNPTTGAAEAPRSRVKLVEQVRLMFSRAPISELAAAAMVAREEAGLADVGADYLVVAVPPGLGIEVFRAVLDAADEAVAEQEVR